MNQNFLDFEQPIAELEAKISELRHASQGSAFNIEEEIGKLRDKLRVRTEEIFRDLTPWQVAQLARHPLRQELEGAARRVPRAANLLRLK